ncbi:MAG: hypothetical protein JW816_01040 [Candidatus Buchananbacteria bacterium]|nr:hypothetical protein [Candidatus Buchananbacteria bacterium]
MNLLKSKIKKIILPSIFLIVIGSFLFGYVVLAANINTGLDYGTYTGLGSQDIRISIMRIVQIALGLVGIIAVVLILYAGFIWLTSGGNEEKITQAKKIISGAVIGLVIILLSFSIVSFVINKLIEATEANGQCQLSDAPRDCSVGSCEGSQTCQADGRWGICDIGTQTDCFSESGGNGSYCRVSSIKPDAGDGRPMNSVVRIWFNNTNIVNADQIQVINSDSASPVDGVISVVGSLAEFKPNQLCSAFDSVPKDSPAYNDNCFDPLTNYSVNLTGLEGVVECGGKKLNCDSGQCLVQFKTSNGVDVVAPKVDLIGKQICQNSDSLIQAIVSDDHGIDSVEFDDLSNNFVIGRDFSIGTNWPEFASSVWDTSIYPVNSVVSVQAQALDFDSHTTISSAVDFTIHASHCCNQVKDADETAVDCGGNDCEACVPTIEWVLPKDGAPDNLITIHGRHFGQPGQVDFTDSNDSQTITANLANTVNSACTDVWTDNEIIAVVPSQAQTGPIKVTDSQGAFDLTNQPPGSFWPDFIINTIKRPGVCSLNPTVGQINDPVVVQGVTFTPAGNKVYFSSQQAGGLPIIISSSQIQGITVPALDQGTAQVKVLDINSEQYSNPKTFSVGQLNVNPPSSYQCSQSLNSCVPDINACGVGSYCNSVCQCEAVSLPQVGDLCNTNGQTFCTPDQAKCGDQTVTGLTCDPLSCTCQSSDTIPGQSTYYLSFVSGIKPGNCSLDQGICIPGDNLCGQDSICDPTSCNCADLPPAICLDNDTAVVLSDQKGNVLIDSSDGFLDLDNFTYAVWVKFNSSTGFNTILNRITPTDSGQLVVRIDPTNDQWQLAVSKSTDQKIVDGGNFDFAFGQWYHLALTVSRSTVSFYVDGQRLGQQLFTDSNSVFNYSQVGNLLIGARQTDPLADFLSGSIDDLAFCKRALSDKEVFYLAQNRLMASDDLISFWRFNEGSGLVSNDEFGNHQAVIANDGATWATGHFVCQTSIGCDLDLSTPICEPDNNKCDQLNSDSVTYVCEASSCTCKSTTPISEAKQPGQSTYAWQFTTSAFGPRVVETCNRNGSCQPDTISSPTPFSRPGTLAAGYRVSVNRPDDGPVPIDSVVGIQFTDLMYRPSLNSQNLLVYDCGDAQANFSADNCINPIPVDININDCSYQSNQVNSSCVNLTPENLLTKNHWYQVDLVAKNILSKNGIDLASNEAAGNYKWVFQTRNSDVLSQVACLYIKPAQSILYSYNQTQLYTATPAPSGFNCVEIRPESCSLDNGTTESFSWSVLPGSFLDASAAVIVPPQPTASIATVAARKDTNNKNVEVQAICNTARTEFQCSISRESCDPTVTSCQPTCSGTNESCDKLMYFSGGTACQQTTAGCCSESQRDPITGQCRVIFSSPANQSIVSLGVPTTVSWTGTNFSDTDTGNLYLYDATTQTVVSNPYTQYSTQDFWNLYLKSGSFRPTLRSDISPGYYNFVFKKLDNTVVGTSPVFCSGPAGFCQAVVNVGDTCPDRGGVDGGLCTNNGICTAAISGDIEQIKGSSSLKINFSGPVIIDRWPDCGTACLNSAIGAQFSQPINHQESVDNDFARSIVNPANVSLYYCYDNAQCSPGYGYCKVGNAACVVGTNCSNGSPCVSTGDYQKVTITNPIYETENILTCSQSGRVCDDLGVEASCGGDEGVCQDSGQLRYIFDFYPTLAHFNGLLAPNSYYRVVISDQVGAENGNKNLNGLNYDDALANGIDPNGKPDSYSWVFKTQADFNLCQLDHVTVQPANIRTNKNQDSIFSSKPFAIRDICDPDFGQRLNPFSYNWAWRSVAKEFLFDNATTICSAEVGDLWAFPFDIVNPTDQLYCTNNLYPGSSRYLRDGCGNGIVEIGEDCDTGRLGLDDGCSDQCLSQPIATAVCGNGVIETGEQCEPSIDGTVYCNDANCLWKGVTNKPGDIASCGNGVIETGEQCDPPNSPGCNDKCLLTGSVSGLSLCGDGLVGVGENCDNGEFLSCTDIQTDISCRVGIDPGCFSCTQSSNSSWIACTGSQCTNTCQSSCQPTGAGVCSSECLLKDATETGNTNYNVSICGNGVVEKGESCDDGNNVNGDGCSDICLHEGSQKDGRIDPYQSINSINDGQTYIQAWSTQQSQPEKRGQGLMSIGLGGLPSGAFAVISRWPDCASACINAVVGGRFSHSANPNTIQDDPSSITLYVCGGDSQCGLSDRVAIAGTSVTLTNFGDGSVNDEFNLYLPVNYNPIDTDNNPQTPAVPSLLPNTWYRVVVHGSIKDTENKLLSGLNFDDPKFNPSWDDYNVGQPDSYSWVFKTQDNENICTADQITVEPKALSLHEGQEKYLYSSIPLTKPDQCNINGQRLNPYYYDWSWSHIGLTVDPNKPNNFLQGAEKFLAASYDGCGNGVLERGELCERQYPNFDFPAGCNPNTCRWQGTQVCSGSITANCCGNGIIEAGEECDFAGQTLPGSVPNYCGSSCLWTGNSSQDVSICGDGKIGANEQCDFGTEPNGDDSDGCTDTCQFAGALPGTGAVCGDGQISFGEECDNNDLAQGKTPVSDGFCTGLNDFPEMPCSSFSDSAANCQQIDPSNAANNHNAFCYWTGNSCKTRPCLLEWNLNPPARFSPGNANWYLSACGNGVVEYGETCDDGNTSNGYCSADGQACSSIGSGCGVDNTGLCLVDGCSDKCLVNGSVANDSKLDPYQIMQTVYRLHDSDGGLLDPNVVPQVQEDIRASQGGNTDLFGAGRMTILSGAKVPFAVIGHQPPPDPNGTNLQCRNVAIWAVVSQPLNLTSLYGKCQSGVDTGSGDACMSSADCTNDGELCIFDNFKVCQNDCSNNPNLVASLSYEPLIGQCISNNCQFIVDGQDPILMADSYCTNNSQCQAGKINVGSIYNDFGANADILADQPIEIGYLPASQKIDVQLNAGATPLVDKTNDVLDCLSQNPDRLCQWQFSTSADFCHCDYVGVKIDNTSVGNEVIKDYYTCAGNQCGSATPDISIDDDVLANQPGNQHLYQSTCYDLKNQTGIRIPLSDFNLKFEWAELDPDNILYLAAGVEMTPLISVAPAETLNRVYVTPGVGSDSSDRAGQPAGKNGQAIVKVMANEFVCSDGQTPCDFYSDPSGQPCPGQCYSRLSAQQDVNVINFICDNPWPSITNFPYQDNESNFKDPDTNFLLYYCRDNGKAGFGDDLPRLNDKTNIVLSGTDASQNLGPNVLKDFIFPLGDQNFWPTTQVNWVAYKGPYTWQAGSCPSGSQLCIYGGVTDNNCTCKQLPDLAFTVQDQDNYSFSFETFNGQFATIFGYADHENIKGLDITQLEQANQNLFDPNLNYNGHEIEIYLQKDGQPLGDPVKTVTHRAFGENNVQKSTISLGNLEPGNYNVIVKWLNDWNNPAADPAANDANLVLKDFRIYPSTDATGDAIGIRVMKNPLHLSPATWYRSGLCRIPGTAEMSNICFSESDCPIVKYCDADGSGGIESDEQASCQNDSQCLGVNNSRCLPAVNNCQFNVSQRGTASPAIVDGYQAVTDGRTIYVGATNRRAGDLYSNIYLLSYSQGANSQTTEIFKRILDPNQQNGVWSFNSDINYNPRICATIGNFAGTNISCGPSTTVDQRIDQIGASNFSYCSTLTNQDSCNAKTQTAGCLWSEANQVCVALACQPIYCQSNFDCPDLNCQAPKDQLIRDAKRFGDLRQVQLGLNSYYSNNGSYPILNSGTFVASTTLSIWPSWTQTFGSAIGGVTSDPINQAIGCPADNPSCWNQASERFLCPDDAYIYGYRSSNAGQAYELYSNFEYHGPGSWRTRPVNDLYQLPLIGVENNQCQLLNFEISAQAIGGSCDDWAGDSDTDQDGICDYEDNCQLVSNPSQRDSDNNGIGDACDPNCSGDRDTDGVCDETDICRTVPNPRGETCISNYNVYTNGQCDADQDGIGDACDPCTDLDYDGKWDLDTSHNTCPEDNVKAVIGQTSLISNDHYRYCVVSAAGANLSEIGNITILPNPSVTCSIAGADCSGSFSNLPAGQTATCLDMGSVTQTGIPGLSSLITYNPGQEDYDNDGTGYIADFCIDYDKDGFGDWPFYTNSSDPTTENVLTTNQKQHFQACQPPASSFSSIDLDNCPGGPSGVALNCYDPDLSSVVISCSNPSQIDTDGDLYGDICDLCDPSAQCCSNSDCAGITAVFTEGPFTMIFSKDRMYTYYDGAWLPESSGRSGYFKDLVKDANNQNPVPMIDGKYPWDDAGITAINQRYDWTFIYSGNKMWSVQGSWIPNLNLLVNSWVPNNDDLKNLNWVTDYIVPGVLGTGKVEDVMKNPGSMVPPPIDGKYPWDDAGITAAGETLDFGWIISKDKIWFFDFVNGDYDPTLTGRLDQLWSNAPTVDGLKPWEGGGVTAFTPEFNGVSMKIFSGNRVWYKNVGWGTHGLAKDIYPWSARTGLGTSCVADMCQYSSNTPPPPSACGDGYCAYGENCPVDCPVEDWCSDLVDNNANGCIDGADWACRGSENNCSDGIDNNCNGLVDSSDPDCSGAPDPTPANPPTANLRVINLSTGNVYLPDQNFASALPDGNYGVMMDANAGTNLISSWSMDVTKNIGLVANCGNNYTPTVSSVASYIQGASPSYDCTFNVDGNDHGGGIVKVDLAVTDSANIVTDKIYNYTGSIAECPRIDAFIAGSWQTVGRAIYKKSGIQNIGQWDIDLPVPASRFRLVEDEPEISYINWIRGDDQLWNLGAIETKPASYFGATDGSVHEFSFEKPVTKLSTYGYYEYINN